MSEFESWSRTGAANWNKGEDFLIYWASIGPSILVPLATEAV